MTILAIVDTETSDVTPDAQATEKGLILYDTQHGSIVSLSTLLPSTKTSETEAITGITQEMIDVARSLRLNSLETVFEGLIAKADYVIAHNAEFDKRFWSGKHYWLCTMKDFCLTAYNGKRDLISISLAMGIPVFNPHRALNDCALLAAIFDRFRFNGSLEERLNIAVIRSQSPLNKWIALIPYEQKGLVKEWRSAQHDRFFWDEEVGGFVVEVKDCDLTPSPFPVRRLEEHLKILASPSRTIRARTEFHEREAIKNWRSAEGHQFRWNPELKVWELKLNESQLRLLDTLPIRWEIA